MNLLEEIQHFGTGLVWYNQNMKGHFLFISNTCSMLIVSDFFPRSDDWLGKRKFDAQLHLHLTCI
jgi:hypothetical protein